MTTSVSGVAGSRSSYTEVSAVGATAIEPLPAPVAELDAIQDELAMLFVALAALRDSQDETSLNEVESNQLERKNAEAARDAALAAAKAASEEGGIYKWLTEDIGLLGVAGLATFNYGLVAADIGLHKSGLVGNLKIDLADGLAAMAFQAHPEILVADILLRKLDIAPAEVKGAIEQALGPLGAGVSDEDVKPIVDKAVKINLLVAGAATTLLTAGSTTALLIAAIGVACSAGAFASTEAGGPEWLTVGLAVASAALCITAGLQAGSAAVVAAKAAKAASAGINGVNGAIGGADTVIAAVHQNEVDDANKAATEARRMITKLERLLDELIDGLESSRDSQQRTRATVDGALQTHNQTLSFCSSQRV